LPLALYLGGQDGALWPLFGATNQLLAGLSLVVVTTWLFRSGRPWQFVGIPMVFVLAISALSMAGNLADYLEQGNYLLVVVGGLILALEIWIVLEAWSAVRRLRSKPGTDRLSV
jgi:carbon starvation protein